jgi:radical SAM superfamily enzyme
MPASFLRDAHIKFVELGIETYNDNILESLNKRHSAKKFTDRAMQHARDNNINVIPNIIIGLTWDNNTK